MTVAAFNSGVQAFQAAAAQLNQAAARINGVRANASAVQGAQGSAFAAQTPPASLRTEEISPEASANTTNNGSAENGRTAADGRNRAPSGLQDFSDRDFVRGAVDLIQARQQASAAATSIRAADELTAQLLDATA